MFGKNAKPGGGGQPSLSFASLFLMKSLFIFWSLWSLLQTFEIFCVSALSCLLPKRWARNKYVTAEHQRHGLGPECPDQAPGWKLWLAKHHFHHNNSDFNPTHKLQWNSNNKCEMTSSDIGEKCNAPGWKLWLAKHNFLYSTHQETEHINPTHKLQWNSNSNNKWEITFSD